MNAAQRKADWARTTAILKSRSYDVKFDLENTDYKRVENIGAGAYGVVCSAIHKRTGDRIAIKKIPNVFDIHVTAMRTYREIKILKHFHHDNVISIVEILKPKEQMDSFKDIYVVLDLMESDLHRIIHSKQDLTDEHIRYFLYQLLRGLKYIHSANVIHRDLKPSNLLVNEDCQLKIGDFGMARGMSSTNEDKNVFMTQYVATRWYRAPEIMLSLSNYTSAVDIWSVGCILAEMLSRKHLFPGTDVLNQLKLIIGVLGSPSEDFLDLMQLDVIKKLIKDWGHKEPLPLVTLFPGANRKALDLLSKMLTLNPKHRITAEEALNHPYLSKYHDPEDEPICIPAFNFDFEKRKDLRGIKLRHAIVSEIYGHRHSPVTTPTFNAVLKPVDVPDEKVNQGQTTGLQAFLNQLDQKQSPQQNSTVNRTDPVKKEQNDSTTKINTFDSTSEEKVFKIPTNKVTSTALEVEGSHNVQTSELSSSRDIEMLSAHLTDQKGVSLSTIPAPSVKPVNQTSDSKENVCEKQENKTISDDTKATLKAALLNARKQRAENAHNEKMEQNKKVTALSRKKEKMQKRKEKADRAKRKEKLKERTGTQQGIELSDADKELLLRWNGMQQKNPSTATATVTQESNVGERALRDLPSELANQNQGDNPIPISQPQQHGVQTQVPAFILPRPNQGQSCAFQGQVLYRVDNGAKKPETRKSFPLEAQGSVSINSDFNRHATDSNNHQNNSNAGLKSRIEFSNADSHNRNLDSTKDKSPMLKRNSTGSAVLSQESTSKAVPWRESSENRLFGSHRGSDPLLPGYSSPPQDSPQTSQSESGSTPSQGLSPLAVFDESSFGLTVPSPEAEFLFQKSHVPTPFQFDKDNNACNVPMFGENSLAVRPTNLTPATPLANLERPISTLPSQRLKINPCAQEVNDQEMLSANISRTNPAVQTSLHNNSSSTEDWVSMLSRQFSKYQVEDIYPPALIGTPKGTGGGYGVGLSIDQEMQEGCSNPDSAPLSASLLADWMDVSGNMSARELEAFIWEAELTSPMALSYSDLNMTSS